MNEKVKSDLALALKHIRYAVEVAAKNGTPKLGVLSVSETGGKVECQFDVQLIEDVALLLELPPLTEEDRVECSARSFLDKLGIK